MATQIEALEQRKLSLQAEIAAIEESIRAEKMKAWEIDYPSTTLQRRALYRLGLFSVSFIRSLDRMQADKAIKQGISLKTQLNGYQDD